MKKLYDIAIIGAGPAGATLARELALGVPEYKILLIDGGDDRRGKVCGGLLSPDAQKIMASFNITLPRSVLSEDQIFSVETLDVEKRLSVRYQRSYINMDRYEFDRYLVSLVPETVERMQGRCVAVRREGDGFAIDINSGGISTVLAERVIGADGAGSIVRRQLFKNRDKINLTVAYQEWYSDFSDNVPSYSCIFDSVSSPYPSWTVKKGDTVILGGAFNKEGYKEAFYSLKERLEQRFGYRLSGTVKRESCFVCNPRRMSDFTLGDGGAFLVGEAAGFISPSSYEGIGNAMMSAKALSDAILARKNAKKTIKIYKKATKKQRIAIRIKVLKRRLLFSQLTRKLIMKSKVQSIDKYR